MEPDLRGGQIQDLVQRRGLARTGFADDAERAALLQFEADPVDGAHLADLAAEHHALGELVGLRQIRDAQHHRRVGVGRAPPAARWRRRRSRPRSGQPPRRCGCMPPVWSGATRTQRRFGGAAVVDRERATRRERAARRQRSQRRRGTGDGHQPGALRRRPAGAPSRAVLRCRAFGGRGTASATGATSTARPAYITSARSANSATTPRSWVMMSTPAPVTSRAVLQHVEDLRLHRDVQRGGRLVADDQVGVVGDRDGDDDALALTAGQLVRECAGPALGLRDADEVEQLDRAGAGGRACPCRG